MFIFAQHAAWNHFPYPDIFQPVTWPSSGRCGVGSSCILLHHHHGVYLRGAHHCDSWLVQVFDKHSGARVLGAMDCPDASIQVPVVPTLRIHFCYCLFCD